MFFYSCDIDGITSPNSYILFSLLSLSTEKMELERTCIRSTFPDTWILNSLLKVVSIITFERHFAKSLEKIPFALCPIICTMCFFLEWRFFEVWYLFLMFLWNFNFFLLLESLNLKSESSVSPVSSSFEAWYHIQICIEFVQLSFSISNMSQSLCWITFFTGSWSCSLIRPVLLMKEVVLTRSENIAR